MPGKRIKNVNEVRLVGYVGKDAELRYIASGDAVANLSLATSKSWKDSRGEWVEATQWHNIVAWRDLAEQCTEIRKGDALQVTGRIEYQKWEDKKTGDMKYKTVIVADTIEELDTNGNDGRDASRSRDRAPERGRDARPRERARDDTHEDRSDNRSRQTSDRNQRDSARTERRPARQESRTERTDSRSRSESAEITDEDIPF